MEGSNLEFVRNRGEVVDRPAAKVGWRGNVLRAERQDDYPWAKECQKLPALIGIPVMDSTNHLKEITLVIQEK